MPTRILPAPIRALVDAAHERPRRTAVGLLVIGTALVAGGLALGGSYVAFAFAVAVPAVGAAYGLELRRLWGAAGRGSQ